MASRGLMMQNHSTVTVDANDYIPFTTTLSEWTILTPLSEIKYYDTTKRFRVPFASLNDYLITWHLGLKTTTTKEYPIVGIEYEYNSVIYTDYMIFPARTIQLKGISLFHIETTSLLDTLSFGLKVIGEPGCQYTISTLSDHMVSAGISILAL